MVNWYSSSNWPWMPRRLVRCEPKPGLLLFLPTPKSSVFISPNTVPCISLKPPPFGDEMPSLCWTFDDLVLPTQTYHSRDQMGTRDRENVGNNNNSQTDAEAHLLAQRPVSDKIASPHFPGSAFCATHVQISFLLPQPVPSRCAQYSGVSTV